MPPPLETIASQLRKPEGDFGKKIGENMNIGNALVNRTTIAAMQLSGNHNIAEIGMGNGFFVQEILAIAPSIKYTGCDFSQLMVDESLRLNEAFVAEGRASFHLTNGIELPLASQSFDKVFTINTIYFWDEPALILAEIKRVLQPGGQLYIAGRPKRLMQAYPFTKFGFNLYEKEDVASLLEANGFTITQLIEEEEPPHEMDGLKVALGSMVICAKK